MDIFINGVRVPIDGLEPEHIASIHETLRNNLAQPAAKNFKAIAAAFQHWIEIAPTVNPSDLWHHVIYREFVKTIHEVRPIASASQSWARSSGDAFEYVLQQYYNNRLALHSIELEALFSKTAKQSALLAMGLHDQLTSSKIDLIVRYQDDIIGGIHAKASFAERVTDDIPASRAMIAAGYLSALVTLDVKSFPPSATVREGRAYFNKGELGTPERPTDKRLYIETHGDFDLCLSYNARTFQSLPQTISGKRIFTANLNPDRDYDALEVAILNIAGVSTN